MTSETTTMRGGRVLRFTRWGLAEDPTGAIITVSGRLYDVTGTYRRESPSAVMLTTRHFNGEPGPDVAAGAVRNGGRIER